MPFARRLSPSRAGSRAFTLLELIVVIVILGVLAAIAIPTFLAAQEKSRAAVAAETLSAEDRDARALMTLRNDGSTVPSADDYATAASELQASGLGLLAAQGRRIYIPSSASLSSASSSLANVSTYSAAPLLNPGEISLGFSAGQAGLATLTSGGTCVLVVDSGSGALTTLTKTNLGANCNGATALLSPSSLASVGYLAAASSPAAPTLAGSWGNQSVALSWAAPSSNGANITGYNLYQNGVKVSTLAGTALSASVTGLTNGTQYSFTLSALNAVGEGSQSAAVVLTPATLPSAPAAPSLVAAPTSIAVSWSAPSANGAAITGYNVYVGGSKVNSTPVTGTSYTLSGLQAHTTYSVAITAVNAAGEGPISGTSSTTTPYAAPVISSATFNVATGGFTLTGSGFGTTAPYSGTGNVWVNDSTANWQGGYPGNGISVVVTSWSDTSITVSSLTNPYNTNTTFRWHSGDALSVSVIGAQSGLGPVAATPTLSPSYSGTISASSFAFSASGSGFGTGTTYTNSTGNVWVDNYTAGWQGGHAGNGIKDTVSAWSDTSVTGQLVLSQGGGYSLAVGDAVYMQVLNPSTNVLSSVRLTVTP